MSAAIDQTPLLSWRGADVSVKAVLDELQRLEGELARTEATGGEQPRPRTSSMNLVAISWDGDATSRAARVLDGLAVHHPSRIIIVEVRNANAPPRLDAEILVGARELSPGLFFPFERIVLKVDGEACDHVVNLVEPFLQPDLGTHVWWMGDPPLTHKRLLDVVPMCATMLIDSSAFSRPFDEFRDLANFVAHLPENIGVEDLHWSRLHPWREVLAQFFAAPDTARLLPAIRAVGVDYVGEGRGNRVAVALLVGWLSSALGWTLRRAIGDEAGRILAAFTSADGTHVEFGCQPSKFDSLQPGDIVAIRLHAGTDGPTAAIAAERDARNPLHVRVRIDVDGKVMQHVLAMQQQQETDLLVRALVMPGADFVYLRSLAVAGELMQSLK